MDKPQSEPNAQKSNITRFRRDKRLSIIGVLRSAALLLMLGTVIYGVWAFQDDLNIQNMRRLISYAKAASGSSDSFAAYRFEAGVNAVYAPFEMGLAVVSNDSYRFVTGFSGAGYSTQIRYTSPAVCPGERQLLIYDRGNLGYSVVNGYSVLHEGVSSSPIVSATMNQSGDYALVTQESGYRGGVYIYSAKNREMCVWQTPNYYIRQVSLSPKADRFAALCYREQSAALVTEVRVYALGGEQPLFVATLGEREVYALWHDKAGHLYILYQDGLMIYDETGQMVGQSSFSGLVWFACHEGDLPMVAMRTGGAGEQIRVQAFDAAGAVTFEQQLSGSLRDMDYRDGYAMLLFYDRVVTLNMTDPAAVQTQVLPVEGVRHVLCGESGQGVIVYSDRAEAVDLTGPSADTQVN